MLYHLDVEDMEPGHWIAYVRELPGCFSSTRAQAEAISNAPSRIAAHFEWLASHGRPAPQSAESIETQVAEVFRSFASKEDPEYIVNALFEDDRYPLTKADVEEGLWLLDRSQRDLMDVVSGLSPDQLTRSISGEVNGSIAGVLLHVGIAEWWYFDRLAMSSERETLSADPFTRLEQVRSNTRAQLPKLVGDMRIVTLVGEQWSARKISRRAVWHERDHTQQINAYRSLL
ncbi:MAG TPA: type II toxin-antitoxin system HicB family antitoxin [Anaerolineales bacterium]|nr:type II toxin-antitoxin system HicB family antitoxin [Anaerolineales bacterium]